MFNTSDEWIQQRTGIKERRFIEHDKASAPATWPSPPCRWRCERAGLRPPRTIDAIIFATLSPDYNFPGSAVLDSSASWAWGVPALDIRNQCSGFLYGLQIADAWIRCGMYKRVLLVGAEVHSTGLDLTNEGRDVAVLFGDGAGAAILGPTEDPSAACRA
jgi:3-oxoacyl-[acyl-carrier-protein] synthase-3